MVGTPDGKRHPVVGRICMDMVMVNLEDNIYPLDSEFEIMGSKSTDIYQWSSACNMIPYEILTGLGRRWTRCYIKNGNVIDILRSP
jgi:alanine racemase